ncbi:MAG: ABC transporter permease, partial [Verrucomicrobiales bacterium]|nr:ABC transporter permease [Verrucomicrobiales bacterium]
VGEARRNGGTDFHFNYPLFLDYQRDHPAFSHLAATSEMDIGLGTGGATERLRAMVVSGNYFSLLGVEAALGRTFAADEGREIDSAPVLVLSHGLWQRSFGADPRVIGRVVSVNGHSFTIIGIAPREFTGTTRGSSPDLYLPITMYGRLDTGRPGGEHPLRTRYFTWHYIFGRLKDGVSLEQAQVSMQLTTDRLNESRPPNTPERIALLPGVQGFTHDLRDVQLPMKLLLATAALVLLIACANLANLQLARATARTREFAVRLALGAGRPRVVRQLLTESVLLAVGGGVLGLLVAAWLVHILQRFRPPDARVDLAMGLDLRVLLFTFTIAVMTGLLFGLVPAWRASRPQLVPELKGAPSGASSRSGRWGFRGILVILQVGLSFLVLVGAGLCVRSLANLQRIDPGTEPSKVVLASFNLGLNDYSKPRAAEFYERLLERVRTLPGVEAASLGLITPLNGRTPGMSVERVEDYQPASKSPPTGDFNIVAPDYFRTLGVPRLQGRDFQPTDTAGGPAVVIVNEAFAARYWPGQNPVGKRLWQHGANGGTPTEVIGVVANSPTRRLTDAPRPAFYFPLSQKPDLSLTLTVRTGLEPAGTIRQLHDLVRSMDAQVPVFEVRTLAQQKDGSLALERMAATLLGGFGVLALLLAALGLYGVLAYSVSQRTREIGVRMALGACMADVLRMVLRQGVGLATTGLTLGILAAFGLTRFLRSFLFQVPTSDPWTYGAVALGLTAVALVACWLPARRATRVNPMEALRGD